MTYAERWLPTLLWWPVSLAASALIAIHYLPGFIPCACSLGPCQRQPADPDDLAALGQGPGRPTLLAWWLRRPKQPLVSLDITALAFCLTFFAVPLLSIMTNAASWQPKWPDAFWWWLVLNVGVVSLAEEAFFRGLLQSQLIRWFGAWPGIIVATLAYAALHLLVNPVYALLAGIAGLGYGMVLHFSGRLSLAVLLHASINTPALPPAELPVPPDLRVIRRPDHQRQGLLGELIETHRSFRTEPGGGPGQRAGEEAPQDERIALAVAGQPRLPSTSSHICS